MTDTPAPPATATEARTVLDARIQDKDWSARLLNGDIAAKKEMKELTSKIADGGDDVVAVAMSGKLPDTATTDQRHMAATADLFRSLGIRDAVVTQFLSGHQVSASEFELVSNWKKESMGDPEFVKRLLAGEVKARQQMTLANSVLVNGARSA
jgi:hypothetical protein